MSGINQIRLALQVSGTHSDLGRESTSQKETFYTISTISTISSISPLLFHSFLVHLSSFSQPFLSSPSFLLFIYIIHFFSTFSSLHTISKFTLEVYVRRHSATGEGPQGKTEFQQQHQRGLRASEVVSIHCIFRVSFSRNVGWTY